MGGGVFSATPRPSYPWERDPVPIVYEAGWAPWPVWTGVENLAPLPGFDPRTVHSVARCYTYSHPVPQAVLGISSSAVISVIIQIFIVIDNHDMQKTHWYVAASVIFLLCKPSVVCSGLLREASRIVTAFILLSRKSSVQTQYPGNILFLLSTVPRWLMPRMYCSHIGLLHYP